MGITTKAHLLQLEKGLHILRHQLSIQTAKNKRQRCLIRC